MESNVRVRFAPSPTGPLHIGGLRTALFNYLFAKQNNGEFILRIEDTDKNRFVEGAEQYIEEAMNWTGINFSEGPYKQSDRKEVYKKHIGILLEKGMAYYAFDGAEELDAHRKNHEAKGKTFIYNWHNRLKLSNSLAMEKREVEEKILNGERYVVRFKCCEENTIKCNDLIRGVVSVDPKLLDDKILYKSDGMPTYHLANVVDDHLMKISHVIRGEEWLPSLPLHVMLYDAFGWEKPSFAHLPLILNPTGKGKLSKRDGDKLGVPVFPLQWQGKESQAKGFREEGYLPEALVNFMAFLGWNPGSEEEVFSLESLVSNFNLEKVNSSGAKFDVEKLKWFNHKYLQLKDNFSIAEHVIKENKELKNEKVEMVAKAVGLTKERANTLTEVWPLCSYLFVRPKRYNEKVYNKISSELTLKIIEELCSQIKKVESFKEGALSEIIKGWINEKEYSFGSVMQPARLALVGELKGIDLFLMMEFIGKEESVTRLVELSKTLKVKII
jgi:glutamyl-tRNA synthetase